MSGVGTRYPGLQHFLSTEFIQDSEDERGLGEIAAGFVRVYGAARAAAVAGEIRAFLGAHPHGLERAFAGFGAQVEPRADGLTVRGWLEALAGFLGGD